MPAIATINSTTKGHGSFPPAKASEDAPKFTVKGQPVLVDGDKFLPHSDGDSTHQGAAISSRPKFTVGGKGIVCVGDSLTCGDKVATGEGTMQIA